MKHTREMYESDSPESHRMESAAKVFAPHLSDKKIGSIVISATFEGPADDEAIVATGLRVIGNIDALCNTVASMVSKANQALRQNDTPISMSLILHHHPTGDRQVVVDGPKDALTNDKDLN